jgi:hypothetical protein
MNSTEIEKAIDEKLHSLFIDVTVTGGGETMRDNWKCDAWNVVFQRGAQKELKRFSFPFYTGIGLRQSKLKRPKFVNPNSIAAADWDKANLKPVAPKAASFLASVLRDGQAIETSFEYWCSDYGYDTDSIKAFQTYQACCEIGKQVNQFFSSAERAELFKLLEDY